MPATPKSASPSSAPARTSKLFHAARVFGQIALIVLIWWVATYLTEHWARSVPAGIAGIAIALVLMALGLLRREWVADGATWLLREMLLFFVPVVIAIIQYPELMRQHGLVMFIVIVLSTACVMVITAFAVDLAWRIDQRRHTQKPGEQA